jgi:hypothetical protein
MQFRCGAQLKLMLPEIYLDTGRVIGDWGAALERCLASAFAKPTARRVRGRRRREALKRCKPNRLLKNEATNSSEAVSQDSLGRSPRNPTKQNSSAEGA